MSKTEFNSYLIKAILHVLKQFFRQKHRPYCKKHGGGGKLILNNLLSTGDYAVFYQNSLSSYTADSRLGANAPRRLSAHIKLEFVE